MFFEALQICPEKLCTHPTYMPEEAMSFPKETMEKQLTD